MDENKNKDTKIQFENDIEKIKRELIEKHPLKLTNTMGRKKEIFKPIHNKKVGMYTCGPTVYNYAHIGNLRTYIFEDILRRVLEYNGYQVTHVMNITDVGHLTSDSDTGEDKVEKSAKEKNMDAWELSRFYTKAFLRDLKELNIELPHIMPKATEHIEDMIKLIKKLEEKGYTYEIPEEGIYFDTSKVPDYGKLANLNINGLLAGARVEFVKGKRNKTDFALWKFSPKDKKRQMEWNSPWGIGFPGWHIECSTMSMKYLGEQFDIHCGGVDHIPVHHTNEIAQSESATGKKPWVRYWLHGEFLVMDKGKMSKSSGEFLTLQVLINKEYDPMHYRYFCLNTHYRKQLKFSFDALNSAKNAYEKLIDNIISIRLNPNKGKVDKEKQKEFLERFIEAINDDLNMPQSLAVLWEVVRSNLNNTQKIELITEFDKVLGLRLMEKSKLEIPEEIQELLKEREKYRQDKKWEQADKIREKIRIKGYEVIDTPQGSFARKKQ